MNKKELNKLKKEIDYLYQVMILDETDIEADDDFIVEIIEKRANSIEKLPRLFQETKDVYGTYLNALIAEEEFEYCAKIKELFLEELRTYFFIVEDLTKKLKEQYEIKKMLAKIYDESKSYEDILKELNKN